MMSLLWLCCLFILIASGKTQPKQQNDANFQFNVAASNGDIIKMRRALEQGADINQINWSSNNTALLAAARNARGDVVEFLLKQGADPYIPGPDGLSAWHQVCRNGLLTVAQVLKEFNVDPTKPYPPDDIPILHRCAWTLHKHQLKVMEAILDLGVDPNLRSWQGITPIMTAAKRPNLATLKLLLKRGGDANAVDGFGRNALFYVLLSLKEGLDDYDRLLKTEEGPFLPPLEEYKSDFIATVKFLTDNGADPTRLDNNQESPFMVLGSKLPDEKEILDLMNKAYERNRRRQNKKSSSSLKQEL